jgi:uncharacterized protein (TIGR02001 family)
MKSTKEQSMKKTLFAVLFASAFAAPAMAQTAAAAPEAAPASPHTLTSNLGLFSSYRFRGIDQTYGKPALQGGIDYAHASGLYAGNWNSNVSSGAGYPDGNLEMDFYGGFKKAFGDFGVDVGALYYYYPGSEARGMTSGKNTGAVDNKELYIAGSWKFLSLKYNYALDDYFSARGTNGERTRGTSYYDLSANYDLGEGWGINGHFGHLAAKNITNGSYNDWKLGVTKDLSGWVVGLAYIDTDAHGTCGTSSTAQPYCLTNSMSDTGTGTNNGSKSKDAGKATAMLSVSRTF